MTHPARPTHRAWLPWLLSGASVAAILVLLVKGVLPATERAERAQQEVTRLQQELGATQQAVAEERAKMEQLLQAKDSLNEERTAIAQRLEAALKEKEEALAALEAARKDLTDTLESQIAAGDVLIQERKGELVVDVADQLLFDVGSSDLNAKGKELLKRVATSMRRLPAQQVFQVGGHTDSQPVVSKDLAKRFPTNWELSAARATNVVRFLQETGRVPGKQLVAAAFSQHRPTASNRSEAGRKKNRRIEIVLLKNSP